MARILPTSLEIYRRSDSNRHPPAENGFLVRRGCPFAPPAGGERGVPQGVPGVNAWPGHPACNGELQLAIAGEANFRHGHPAGSPAITAKMAVPRYDSTVSVPLVTPSWLTARRRGATSAGRHSPVSR